MDIAELQRAVDEAKKRCIPRAIVVINPGNPTGVQHTCLFLSEDILLLKRVCSSCEN
jgi:aspartate/methionine/tyrosine aminotransferase